MFHRQSQIWTRPTIHSCKPISDHNVCFWFDVNETYQVYNFLFNFIGLNVCFFRYATRVRSIVNDPSKNVSSKEVVKLKKQVAYWKDQAGRRGDDEDLEEIQEVRTTKERTDGRHSM